jgi:hypothetical protein
MDNGNDVGGLRVRDRAGRRSPVDAGSIQRGRRCIAEFSPGLLKFLSLADAWG